MGAKSLVALELVAWPLESLGREVLHDVLRGGADVAREARVAIVVVIRSTIPSRGKLEPGSPGAIRVE
jgi:selenophosphate synthase